jgi:hypothetical protein
VDEGQAKIQKKKQRFLAIGAGRFIGCPILQYIAMTLWDYWNC